MKNPNRSSLLQDIGRAGLMMAIAVALVLVPKVASAHAVLVQSSPSINATVSGPELEISMKFNSRVDGARSTLLLSTPGNQSKPLPLEKQSAPDTVSTHASGLISGKYTIRWQVLAVDGHITRGQIPFEVK